MNFIEFLGFSFLFSRLCFFKLFWTGYVPNVQSPQQSNPQARTAHVKFVRTSIPPAWHQDRLLQLQRREHKQYREALEKVPWRSLQVFVQFHLHGRDKNNILQPTGKRATISLINFNSSSLTAASAAEVVTMIYINASCAVSLSISSSLKVILYRFFGFFLQCFSYNDWRKAVWAIELS